MSPMVMVFIMIGQSITTFILCSSYDSLGTYTTPCTTVLL